MGRKNITFKKFLADLFEPDHEKLVSFADFSKVISEIIPLA